MFIDTVKLFIHVSLSGYSYVLVMSVLPCTSGSRQTMTCMINLKGRNCVDNFCTGVKNLTFQTHNICTKIKILICIMSYMFCWWKYCVQKTCSVVQIWKSKVRFLHHMFSPFTFCLKGKFPQTTMWIGRVESNFRNPTVKVWADFDNPFKRSDYAKLLCRPLWMKLCQNNMWYHKRTTLHWLST